METGSVFQVQKESWGLRVVSYGKGAKKPAQSEVAKTLGACRPHSEE